MTAERVAAVVGGIGIAAAVVALLRRRSAEEQQQRNGACCDRCARNAAGRSTWRSPLGADRRWAPWVYELAGQNGVYLIRPLGGGDVLYIGESHRGRLIKTLTRHLWKWDGRGSGPTYDPRRVEVAIELFDEPEDAIDRQFELIRQLEPRDNVFDGHSLASLADAPF